MTVNTTSWVVNMVSQPASPVFSFCPGMTLQLTVAPTSGSCNSNSYYYSYDGFLSLYLTKSDSQSDDQRVDYAYTSDCTKQDLNFFNPSSYSSCVSAYFEYTPYSYLEYSNIDDTTITLNYYASMRPQTMNVLSYTTSAVCSGSPTSTQPVTLQGCVASTPGANPVEVANGYVGTFCSSSSSAPNNYYYQTNTMAYQFTWFDDNHCDTSSNMPYTSTYSTFSLFTAYAHGTCIQVNNMVNNMGQPIGSVMYGCPTSQSRDLYVSATQFSDTACLTPMGNTISSNNTCYASSNVTTSPYKNPSMQWQCQNMYSSSYSVNDDILLRDEDDVITDDDVPLLHDDINGYNYDGYMYSKLKPSCDNSDDDVDAGYTMVQGTKLGVCMKLNVTGSVMYSDCTFTGGSVTGQLPTLDDGYWTSQNTPASKKLHNVCGNLKVFSCGLCTGDTEIYVQFFDQTTGSVIDSANQDDGCDTGGFCSNLVVDSDNSVFQTHGCVDAVVQMFCHNTDSCGGQWSYSYENTPPVPSLTQHTYLSSDCTGPEATGSPIPISPPPCSYMNYMGVSGYLQYSCSADAYYYYTLGVSSSTLKMETYQYQSTSVSYYYPDAFMGMVSGTCFVNTMPNASYGSFAPSCRSDGTNGYATYVDSMCQKPLAYDGTPSYTTISTKTDDDSNPYAYQITVNFCLSASGSSSFDYDDHYNSGSQLFPSTAIQKGYFMQAISYGSTCDSSTPLFTTATELNHCFFNQDDNTSYIYSCAGTSGYVQKNVFYTPDCSGFQYQEPNQPLPGLCYPGGVYDGQNISTYFTCYEGAFQDINMDNMVAKVEYTAPVNQNYDDDTSGDSCAKKPSLFQMWSVNTCVNVDNGKSFQYMCSSDNMPSVVMYSLPNCAGTSTPTTLPNTCMSDADDSSIAQYGYICNAPTYPNEGFYSFQSVSYECISATAGYNPFTPTNSVDDLIDDDYRHPSSSSDGDSSSDKEGLGGGAIAGVVIGVLFFVGLAISYYLYNQQIAAANSLASTQQKTTSKEASSTNTENPMFAKTAGRHDVNNDL